MNVTVKWDETDPAILWFIIDGEWKVDEYFAAVQDVVNRVEARQDAVDIIIQWSFVRLPSTSMLAQFVRVVPLIPPGVRTVVVVTTSDFLWVINQLLFKISPRARQLGAVVASAQDAYAVIVERRRAHPVETDAE